MPEDKSARAEQLSPTEAELVERVVNNDKEALSILYDRYVRLVYSLALRMVEKHGVAEEITQDVFVTLWKRGSSYKSERGPFSAWLLSVTHNRCIDELRKKKRQSRYHTVDIEEYGNVLSGHHEEVPNAVLAQLERETILEALSKLPPLQREVILLAYFQGLTQSEISEAMGAPLGTVKTRMRLGLQKMRELLA